MKTPKEIKEFLNNKVLANITGNTPKVETISIDDFLEWFENKPKEENQDTITFDGKEYEFIESDCLSCCINCDLRVLDFCTLSPRICCSDKRRDRKEGYFKLIKPKNLVLIPNEFYYFSSENAEFIIQFKKRGNYLTGSYDYFYLLNVGEKALFIDEWCSIFDMRLATPEEKQQLIDKVQEETGKVWNENTKMFEDKPKDILLPENIKIIKYQNNQLGLVFYDILFRSFNGTEWMQEHLDMLFEEAELTLTK